MGLTPLYLDELPRGTYKIRLAKQGYLDRSVDAHIRRARHYLHARLDRTTPTGILIVDSKPAGARTWLDGDPGPRTPAMFQKVPAGKHFLRVTWEGFEPHEQEIVVLANKSSLVQANLISSGVRQLLDELQKDPSDVQKRLALGRQYVLEGELDRAFEILTSILKANFHEGHSFMADLRSFTRSLLEAEQDTSSPRWNKAVETVMKTLQTTGRPSRRMLLSIHSFLDELRRWSDIYELTTRAINRYPRYHYFYVWRIEAASRIRNWRQVRKDLDALAAIPPRKPDPVHYRNVHEVFVRRKRWKDILRICNAYLPRAQPPGLVHVWRLQALYYLCDWKGTNAQFEQMLKLKIIEKLPATDSDVPYSERKFRVAPDRQSIMFVGAMAKLKAGHVPGLKKLLEDYDSDPLLNYWVPTIRAELWLKQGKGPPPKQVLRVTRCDSPPRVDGRLDEPAGSNAGASSVFYVVNTLKSSRASTTLRALYTTDAVYLGVDCLDALNATRRRPRARGTATIQLYVAPGRDYETYQQFYLYSSGSHVEYRGVKPLFAPVHNARRIYKTLSYSFRAAASRSGWQFGIAIPYKTLGTEAPKRGDAWLINVIRSSSGMHGVPATFAPLAGSYHRPPRFALLIFE